MAHRKDVKPKSKGSRLQDDTGLDRAKQRAFQAIADVSTELERVCTEALWELNQRSPRREVSFRWYYGTWEFCIGGHGLSSERVDTPACRHLSITQKELGSGVLPPSLLLTIKNGELTRSTTGKISASVGNGHAQGPGANSRPNA